MFSDNTCSVGKTDQSKCVGKTDQGKYQVLSYLFSRKGSRDGLKVD